MIIEKSLFDVVRKKIKNDLLHMKRNYGKNTKAKINQTLK
jgi:hypothetical protein